MKLLKQLYLIHSPSRDEGELSKFVQEELKKRGIRDFVVDENRIYKLREGSILLSAHLDQVGKTPIKEVYYFKDVIFGDGNLGADDKNGIWIILRLLEKYPDLSFIFSTEEEAGGNIRDILEDNKDIIESMKYGLVFDRKNGTNIIGIKNSYCEKDMEDALLEVGKDFGFKSESGVWSDANAIRSYIPCINLSVGYYNPHAEDEYTVFSQLRNSLAFSFAIVENINDKFKKPEIPIYTSKRSRYYYGNYKEDDYYDWYGVNRRSTSNVHYISNKRNRNNNGIKNDIPVFRCDECNLEYDYDDLLLPNTCPICKKICVFSHFDNEITFKINRTNKFTRGVWEYCRKCGILERVVNNRCTGCGNDVSSNSYEDEETETYYYCMSCTEYVNPKGGVCPTCGDVLVIDETVRTSLIGK